MGGGTGIFGSGGGLFGLPDPLDLHGNKAEWAQEEFETAQAEQKQILDNPDLDPSVTTRVVEPAVQLPTKEATKAAPIVGTNKFNTSTKIGGLQL